MAFEGLSGKLSAVFKKMRNKGKLKESDIKEAMREVRLALNQAVNRTEISPIRVDQGVFDPVATNSISLSANLPNDAETGNVVNTQFQVYDKLGTQHSLAVAFTKTSGSSWSMAATSSARQNCGN